MYEYKSCILFGKCVESLIDWVWIPVKKRCKTHRAVLQSRGITHSVVKVLVSGSHLCLAARENRIFFCLQLQLQSLQRSPRLSHRWRVPLQ